MRVSVRNTESRRSDNVVYQTARADLLDLEALGFLERRQIGREYRFHPAEGLTERVLGVENPGLSTLVNRGDDRQIVGMPEHGESRFSGELETSGSEEMYLLTVAVAEEDGHQGPLSLSALATTLGVSAASANEMIRKLGVRRLVDYQPYRGVELTEVGRRVARQVLRTRRLWVTFLAEHLDFSPRQADTLACQLEHVTPPEAADRLASYLGNPQFDPLGHAIPTDSSGVPDVATEPLIAMAAGAEVEVIALTDDQTALAFLSLEGIGPGTTVRVVATGTRSVLLETNQGRVHLETDIARTVLVRAAVTEHHS